MYDAVIAECARRGRTQTLVDSHALSFGDLPNLFHQRWLKPQRKIALHHDDFLIYRRQDHTVRVDPLVRLPRPAGWSATSGSEGGRNAGKFGTCSVRPELTFTSRNRSPAMNSD